MSTRFGRGRVWTTGLLALGAMALSSWLGAGPAGAAPLTGRVVDMMSNPVTQVTIDVTDAADDSPISLGNTVQVDGTFSIDVPEGLFDVLIRAADATRRVSVARRDVLVVSTGAALGDIALAEGILMSGVVVRAADATPVSGARLKIVETLTRNPVFLNDDRTNAGGMFDVVVPIRAIDLTILPDAADRLLHHRQVNFISIVDRNLGTIVLQGGVLLAGSVKKAAGGAAVVDATVDVRETATGDPVAIPENRTDTNGGFGLIVPPGTYDLLILPQLSDGLVAFGLDAVDMSMDVDIGEVLLEAGVLLTGRVVLDSNGAAVAGATVLVSDPDTGDPITTPGNVTNASGVFGISVPRRPIDVQIEAPKDRRLVSSRFPMLMLDSDTDLGEIRLVGGGAVTGTVVRASDMTPVGNVAVVAREPAGGSEFVRVLTDPADGSFCVVAPLAAFDILVLPEPGSRLIAETIRNVVIAGDTDLGELALDDGVLLSGRVVRDADSSPVAGATLQIRESPAGARVTLVDDLTDEQGRFSAVVPSLDLDLGLEPPAGERLVTPDVLTVMVDGDTDVGDIRLEEGFFLTGTIVAADGGALVDGADVLIQGSLDAVMVPSRLRDTDASGTFQIAVPAGTWDLSVTTPNARRLASARLVGIDVLSDTDVGTIQLLRGVLVSGVVSDLLGPVEGVTITPILQSTGDDVVTNENVTDAAGRYAFVLASGRYTLKARPQLDEFSRGLQLDTGVRVEDIDVVHDILVPYKDFSIAFRPSPRLAETGEQYIGLVSARNNAGVPLPLLTVIQVREPLRGLVEDVYPPRELLFPPTSRIRDREVRLQIPAVLNGALLGIPVYLEVLAFDANTDELIDNDFIVFEIR